jgi:hypothetical protein
MSRCYLGSIGGWVSNLLFYSNDAEGIKRL